MNKETCERLLAECEQAAEKMGWDFYELMRRAPIMVERLKPYHETAQRVWENARSREDAVRFLVESSDPDLDSLQLEKLLGLIQIIPHVLRGCLQNAAKSLPPSPGGRPRELNPDECREVCGKIAQLYGQGVVLADAKSRMAQHYQVSLSTIQRAWQQRAKVSPASIT